MEHLSELKVRHVGPVDYRVAWPARLQNTALPAVWMVSLSSGLQLIYDPKAFQGLWTLASFSFFRSLYHFQRFQAAHLLQPEPRAGPVAGFELLPISSQVFLLHIKFWHLSEVKTKRALWLMKPSCLLQGGAVKYSSDGRIIIGSSWWRAFRQRGVPFCLHLILAHLPSFSVFFWKVRVMMGCMSELWTLFFLF